MSAKGNLPGVWQNSQITECCAGLNLKIVLENGQSTANVTLGLQVKQWVVLSYRFMLRGGSVAL